METSFKLKSMAAKPNVVVETGSDGRNRHTEKRKSDGDSIDGEPMEKKKISISMSPATAGGTKGPSLSLGNLGKPSTASQKPTNVVKPVKLAVAPKTTKDPPSNLKKANPKVANVFNEDDESDEEEMPPEAKMRMKNIGRNTPTAAGPNSFGKGRLGFCNRQKLLERKLIEQTEEEDKK